VFRSRWNNSTIVGAASVLMSSRSPNPEFLICDEGDAHSSQPGADEVDLELRLDDVEGLLPSREIYRHRKPHPVLIGDRILPDVPAAKGVAWIAAGTVCDPGVIPGWVLSPPSWASEGVA
jgi:hypothetical protein